MKKQIIPLLLGLLMAAGARADTTLTINSTSPYGCLQNASLYQPPTTASNSFSLTGVSGYGAVASGVPAYAPLWSGTLVANFFNYTLDLTHLAPTANHCVKLLIHFGTPQGCDVDEVWGSPSQIQSATLAPFGDITFVFAGGCLQPGQPVVSFTMFSEAAPKLGTVTVIDDYVDPASGTTNEVRINVGAVVPDIAPDPPPWVFLYPARIAFPFFQGYFGCNNITPPFGTNIINGAFDFTAQLMSAPSNGLAVSQLTTQTVQVVNGLFNLPLSFDPVAMGDGSVRWLKLGVRPTLVPAVQFTPLSSPFALTPTPQAYYAYSAGTVADLAPGQAVTSVNGLTDAVMLQAGSGIVLGTNGNTLIVSTQPGTGSDRNIKTGFTTVNPQDILARLVALPISEWRYTNEVTGIRHVGPMAQDFRSAFGLGHGDKLIEFVDAQGVAMAAIQGLNQKLETENQRSDVEQQQTGAKIRELETENADLKARLEKLEGLVNSTKGNNP